MPRLNIPRNTTALEILDALSEWFNYVHTTESSMLWDVLSALRGPDSEDDGLKMRTTEYLRGVFFRDVPANVRHDLTPEKLEDVVRAVAQRRYVDYSTGRPLDNPEVTLEDRRYSASFHFLGHIQQAFNAVRSMLNAAGDDRLAKRRPAPVEAEEDAL